MQPPWITHPDIPLGSMAWRMGHAEADWWAFDAWFRRQPANVRAAFALSHPEPDGWAGFYARKGEAGRSPA